MMDRAQLLQLFLDKQQLTTASRKILAADASFRTYERIIKNSTESFVLMNAPPPENPAQFAFIDQLLEQTGARVPKIIASDLDNGFMLLEDFGDDTFGRLLDKRSNPLPLYEKAIETLIKIQNNLPHPLEGVPLYNFEKMMFEVSLLPDWFCQYICPQKISDDSKKEFIEIWTPIIQKIQDLPKTLVLLDYHVDNLMITPDQSCGVLDFQDARIGPVVYDVVSLLEDERRSVPIDLREKLVQVYLSSRPENERDVLKKSLDLVAMQRHIKVVGIFTRLAVRDHKDKYLKMIPFVWQLIESHLNQSEFYNLKIWLDKYIPKEYRIHTPSIGKNCI